MNGYMQKAAGARISAKERNIDELRAKNHERSDTHPDDGSLHHLHQRAEGGLFGQQDPQGRRADGVSDSASGSAHAQLSPAGDALVRGQERQPGERAQDAGQPPARAAEPDFAGSGQMHRGRPRRVPLGDAAGHDGGRVRNRADFRRAGGEEGRPRGEKGAVFAAHPPVCGRSSAERRAERVGAGEGHHAAQ